MTEEKKLIYIIEDDQSLLFALETKLKEVGFETVTADDGQQALDKLKTIQPNLILLDIKLPRVSGLEILKSIRENEQTKEIPVIIMSQYDDSDIVAQGLTLGAKDYWAKSSYGLNDIVEMVKARVG